MDCPSEESLIRLRLEDHPDVHSLCFLLSKRELVVFHQTDSADDIDAILQSLDLGSVRKETSPSEGAENNSTSSVQKKMLATVLAINALFFVGELLFGYFSNSMGLVADSLDMLADAFVYGLSLWAVSRTSRQKKRIAGWSGYLQLSLAALGIIEVTRRFLGSAEPVDYRVMIPVAAAALIANGVCLYLLKGSGDSEEAHMQASQIFTSNDIVINLSVITAGVLVLALGSPLPDLIVGMLVFLVVTRGAFRILKISR